MFSYIRNKVTQMRVSLTELNNQKIGKTVLVIVLFLDVFILTSIFQGLSDHTRQLVTPYEFIPQHCRAIVIDNEWNEGNRLLRTATITSKHHVSYSYINRRDRLAEVHPVCEPISRLIISIQNDRVLSQRLTTYIEQREQTTEAKSEFERSKGAYDTSLLEVIADKNSASESTIALKRQSSELTETLNSLAENSAASVSLLSQNPLIIELFSVIESSKQDRDRLLTDLRELNLWYPVKRLGMEMIFLTPLIIIFFLWNSKSITANRPYQRLVSSHLLVVVFIPVIFKVIELVYGILPRKFLDNLFDFLESFNLVGLWHYTMMAASIGAALALIYIMQKKIFSQHKITQKRIAKGDCQNCGTHLPASNSACSSCGFKQFRQCGNCHKDTYVYGIYCIECGISE
jgi:hypothetical protein